MEWGKGSPWKLLSIVCKQLEGYNDADNVSGCALISNVQKNLYMVLMTRYMVCMKVGKSIRRGGLLMCHNWRPSMPKAYSFGRTPIRDEHNGMRAMITENYLFECYVKIVKYFKP